MSFPANGSSAATSGGDSRLSERELRRQSVARVKARLDSAWAWRAREGPVRVVEGHRRITRGGRRMRQKASIPVLPRRTSGRAREAGARKSSTTYTEVCGSVARLATSAHFSSVGAYYVGSAATHRLITIALSKVCDARVFGKHPSLPAQTCTDLPPAQPSTTASPPRSASPAPCTT